MSLEQPNETRVGGTKRLIELSLRSMHALRNYAMENSTFQDLMSNKQEWRQLAEYHAVLSEVYKLSMNTQTETPGYISIAYFESIVCQMRLFKRDIYSVMDMDYVSKWPPTQSFNKLPTAHRITDVSKRTNFDKLSKNTNELIAHLRDELQKYTDVADTDMMIARIVNPVMVSMGFDMFGV